MRIQGVPHDGDALLQGLAHLNWSDACLKQHDDGGPCCGSDSLMQRLKSGFDLRHAFPSHDPDLLLALLMPLLFLPNARRQNCQQETVTQPLALWLAHELAAASLLLLAGPVDGDRLLEAVRTGFERAKAGLESYDPSR